MLASWVNEDDTPFWYASSSQRLHVWLYASMLHAFWNPLQRFSVYPHQNATWHVNALKKLPYVSTRERLHMSVLYSSLIVPLHTLHYGKQDKDNFILAWWPIQLIGCIPEGHCIKYWKSSLGENRFIMNNLFSGKLYDMRGFVRSWLTKVYRHLQSLNFSPNRLSACS